MRESPEKSAEELASGFRDELRDPRTMGGSWHVSRCSEGEVSYSIGKYVIDIEFLKGGRERISIIHENGNIIEVTKEVPYSNDIPDYHKMFREDGLEAQTLNKR